LEKEKEIKSRQGIHRTRRQYHAAKSKVSLHNVDHKKIGLQVNCREEKVSKETGEKAWIRNKKTCNGAKGQGGDQKVS